MSRYALRLPEGEVRLAYLNLMLREAGNGGLQQYAVEQFMSGVTGKTVAQVQKMMREKSFPDGTLRGKTPRKIIPAINRKLDGDPSPALIKALHELGGDWTKIKHIDELSRERLWDFITRIADYALKKKPKARTPNRKANRTMVGSFSVPGTAGISGEDIASVLGFGGNPWPGMIWDGSQKRYKDRTNSVFSADKGLFYVVGKLAKAGKVNGVRGLKAKLQERVIRMTSDFVRSVDAGIHAKFEYDSEGQMVVDSIGYEPPPVAEFLMGKRNLRRINMIMQRELASAPGQLFVWKLVMSAMQAGKDVLKTKGGKGKDREITVKAGKLREYAVDLMQRQFGDGDMINPATEKPYKDSIPSQQALQRNFDKIQKKMMAAAEEVMDTTQTSKGSPRDRADERTRDIRETYESDMRGYRSAGKTITASERNAMIRLAAALPVGSPERRAILAGCEKLPEGPMRDNCEKKKEEGASDKKAGKGKLPDALKKHQFTSDDNPNPKGNDKDGDGKSDEKKPFESKKKSARVKSKRESMRMMNDLHEKHGDRTKAYYQAVIDGVRAGVIAPSAVVGGGYKNGKKVAIEWLEGQMKGKKAAQKSARVKSKRESMRMMNDLHEKHGDRTKAYYQAVIDGVRAGVIAPSAVVGGGYKNGKKVAIEWLEGQMKGKKAALIRLASALPVGSDERKTILRMASAH